MFKWPVRVYIEDTDAGGIVYYANYLRYMERARSEWMRSQGWEQSELLKHDVQFVVRKVSLHYKKPAFQEDMLDALVGIEWLKKTGMGLNQIIEKNGKVLVGGLVELTCINLKGRPQAIPEELMDALKQDYAASKS